MRRITVFIVLAVLALPCSAAGGNDPGNERPEISADFAVSGVVLDRRPFARSGHTVPSCGLSSLVVTLDVGGGQEVPIVCRRETACLCRDAMQIGWEVAAWGKILLDAPVNGTTSRIEYLFLDVQLFVSEPAE